MHKSIALMGLFLLSNSVLVPLTANAQTIPLSVSTTTANIESMTTTPVSQVQEPSDTPATLPVIVPATADTSSNSLSVTLTSYNAVPAQTSPTPWLTASGATSNSQVIAARSRDLANELPYGTIIAIMGPDSSSAAPTCGYDSVSNLIGYRVIADSMAARMHDKIDVMLNQHDTVPVNGQPTNPAVALGACPGVTVQVVGYVNPQDIPSTQAGLADLVNSDQNLVSKAF